MTNQQTLTLEQRTTLDKFAAEHGRYWKSKLRALWMTGRDALRKDGGYLRQIRNQQPPHFLDGYRASPVSAATPT
jgi:hypothetical protein